MSTTGNAATAGVGSRWAVTSVATVLSTVALELAVMSGGALVATSRVLNGAPHRLALSFLAATYVVWVVAMRVNLVANWHLLEATGTSTNVFSKAVYDIVRTRSGSRRAMRAASMAGYLLTEAAKEAPYYAGAFGTAVVSDSFDATDAVIFLGGANLGAALYEYGVARLMGTYLARRSRRLACRESPAPATAHAYASFEADWVVPKAYLAAYYQFVEADERATIAYFVDALRHTEPHQPILVFGVGPTLHHVFLAATVASEIHLAEFLPANLVEVERWLAGEDDAHDWRPFVAYTLQCEGVTSPTAEQIRAREELTRSKVTKLLIGDARRSNPLGGLGDAPYHTVISGYCADSATGDKATWEGYLRRIAGLVRPGGLFVTAALRNATGYAVGCARCRDRRCP